MKYQFEATKRIQRMNEIIRVDPDFRDGMEIRPTGSGYDLYWHDQRHQTPATCAMLSCASKKLAEEAELIALSKSQR
jgi:hypothetical protein